MEGDDGLKLEEKKKSEVNNICLPSITSNWRLDEHHKINISFFKSSQISWLTIENIQEEERTRSYKEISSLLKKLPPDWTGKDKFGKVKFRSTLIRCAYGEHKEGESVLAFQVAILQKYPTSNKDPGYSGLKPVLDPG